MKIRGRKLKKFHPFLIAEMQNSWLGNIDKAVGMVKILKGAGWDAVKFQYGRRLDQKDSVDWPELFRQCLKIDICLGTSVDTVEDLETLEQMVFPPHFYKIGAAHNKNLELLNAVERASLPWFISLGGLTEKGLDDLMDMYDESFINTPVLMHSVAEYPTDLLRSQLGVIKKLKNLGFKSIGLSDHSIPSSIVASTAAFGQDAYHTGI